VATKTSNPLDSQTWEERFYAAYNAICGLQRELDEQKAETDLWRNGAEMIISLSLNRRLSTVRSITVAKSNKLRTPRKKVNS
jgi:hypothetical protein